MAWEDWENERTARAWNSVLDVLETGSREFCASRGDVTIAVTRARWDAPDVELCWSSDSVQRNIHMLVMGKRLPLDIDFAVAAWQDPADRPRIWNTRKLSTLHAEDLQGLRVEIARRLPEAFAEASQLSPFHAQSTHAD